MRIFMKSFDFDWIAYLLIYIILSNIYSGHFIFKSYLETFNFDQPPTNFQTIFCIVLFVEKIRVTEPYTPEMREGRVSIKPNVG